MIYFNLPPFDFRSKNWIISLVQVSLWWFDCSSTSSCQRSVVLVLFTHIKIQPISFSQVCCNRIFCKRAAGQVVPIGSYNICVHKTKYIFAKNSSQFSPIASVCLFQFNPKISVSFRLCEEHSFNMVPYLEQFLATDTFCT